MPQAGHFMALDGYQLSSPDLCWATVSGPVEHKAQESLFEGDAQVEC